MKKIIAAAVLFAAISGAWAGYAGESAWREGAVIDIIPGGVPLAARAGFTVPIPEAPGRNTESNKKAVIDYSNSQDGYVMIRYLERTSKQVKVIIEGPGGVSYTYNLRTDGEYDVFPLTAGDGSYSIGVFEQLEGTKYAAASSAKITVALADPFAPFIRPNQYVNFNRNSRTSGKAAELTLGVSGLTDIIAVVYNFVVENFSYDKQLAATVKSGYLPDVDAVLSREMGICFDYAAVMAAMLRSLGIPTKLAVGYAGEVYHAWINAYSEETGWVNQVIFFDGKNWTLMDPTFASSANQSPDVMRYIGDGSNYSTKFVY